MATIGGDGQTVPVPPRPRRGGCSGRWRRDAVLPVLTGRKTVVGESKEMEGGVESGW